MWVNFINILYMYIIPLIAVIGILYIIFHIIFFQKLEKIFYKKLESNSNLILEELAIKLKKTNLLDNQDLNILSELVKNYEKLSKSYTALSLSLSKSENQNRILSEIINRKNKQIKREKMK